MYIRPQDFPWALVNPLVARDVQPNRPLLLAQYGFIPNKKKERIDKTAQYLSKSTNIATNVVKVALSSRLYKYVSPGGNETRQGLASDFMSHWTGYRIVHISIDGSLDQCTMSPMSNRMLRKKKIFHKLQENNMLV